jgi:hypothetical protein
MRWLKDGSCIRRSLESWNQPGEVTGPAITVTVRSDVAVYLSLQTTGNMWRSSGARYGKRCRHRPSALPKLVPKRPRCSQALRQYLCDFSADEVTGAGCTEYYLKAYWNGSPLAKMPVDGDGVTTALQ